MWPGRALVWRNGEIGQEATQEWFREQRRAILGDLGRNATAEVLRDRYSLSLGAARGWQKNVVSPSDDEFETWLQQAYPPPSSFFTKPRYWRSLTWGNPLQPVIGVSWYEAQAYCLWLNALLDTDRYQLPSEAEWEAAGKGKGEWRRYAWFGEFHALRANTAETRLAVTTPVGVFPEGASQDSGLQDLCGNVVEWTSTPWAEGDAWDPSLRSSDGAALGRRVVRGGSWLRTASQARLGCRNCFDPVNRYDGLGFRVCRASHILLNY